MAGTLLRLAEFVLVFFVLPGLFALGHLGLGPIPALLLLTFAILGLLLTDRTFERRRLLGWGRAVPELRRIFLLFGIAAVGIAASVLIVQPEALFAFPRRAPEIWIFVMLLYPIFSAYPQEIVYRAFIFQRYKPLFGEGAGMILASAIAFAFMHIAFGHWLSVVLTFIGGLLFSWTYARSRSLLASAIEHALYGCFAFTIGIGRLFYLPPS